MENQQIKRQSLLRIDLQQRKHLKALKISIQRAGKFKKIMKKSDI